MATRDETTNTAEEKFSAILTWLRDLENRIAAIEQREQVKPTKRGE